MTKYVETAGKWAWRIAALAAFLTLLAMVAGPARSQVMVTSSCVRGSCVYTYGPYDPQGGLGKIIQVQPSLDPDAEHRLQQWESFCQPKIVVDTFGVRRYQYAKTGCEYGRSE